MKMGLSIGVYQKTDVLTRVVSTKMRKKGIVLCVL